MNCLKPIVIKNFKAYGKYIDQLTVPCGKCEVCLSKRSRDWQIRLTEEMKVSRSAFFITLTYNDENLIYADLPSNNNFFQNHREIPVSEIPDYFTAGIPVKRDLQLFLKRLRKQIQPYKIRYYAVSDYTPTSFRPHYHLLIFNIPKFFYVEKLVEKCWTYGFIDVKRIVPQHINYVTKYVNMIPLLDECPYKLPNPFMMCSTRPALGINYYSVYEKKAREQDLLDIFYVKDGYKIPTPRYYTRRYKNEHWTDDQKFSHLLRVIELENPEEEQEIKEWRERNRKLEESYKDPNYKFIWYETSIEQKRRKFVENFWKKFLKSRKLK